MSRRTLYIVCWTNYELQRFILGAFKSKQMHYLVTGGAGFIGSTMTDRLLRLGHRVTVYDNLTTGFLEFLNDARKSSTFRFIDGDLLNREGLVEALDGVDFVFHIAANADVRFGTEHPGKDLEQNTIATFNLLEAMRTRGVNKLAFSSTGSIYGDCPVIPTPEDAPFPVQTSFYGASKLAGEALISAYCEGFGFRSWIFRFVSVLGERYTHGHIFDFFRQLSADQTRLKVLGDGSQRKSYMHVQDCVDGLLLGVQKADQKVNILNLGIDDTITVRDSIGWICKYLKVAPRLEFTGGDRGWIGDSPLIHLDVKRIFALGWRPKFSIEEGVIATVRWIRDHQWVYEKRP